VEDYKSLCAAVTICATLVNTQTLTETAFWPAYVKSSVKWAIVLHGGPTSLQWCCDLFLFDGLLSCFHCCHVCGLADHAGLTERKWNKYPISVMLSSLPRRMWPLDWLFTDRAVYICLYSFYQSGLPVSLAPLCPLQDSKAL